MKGNKRFKGLVLDKKKLPQWIREFAEQKFESYRISNIEQVKGPQHKCTIVGDGQEILILFYFNNDGKTSINPYVGKARHIGVELAEYILSKMELNNHLLKNSSYSLQGVNKEIVDDLIEYLESLQEDGVEKLKGAYLPQNKCTIYQFRSSMGDKITITYYDNQTLQVQGKPMYLYQEVNCFLSAYVDFNEIIEKQAEFFETSIEPVDIRNEMQQLLPNAYSSLNETLRKILSSSLTLRKINVKLEDYTPFVFPALKTLEGYLKGIFKEKGIIVKKEGFGPYIEFNENEKRHVLKPEIKDKINCKKTELAVERLYNYYNKQRHSLFHAEAIAESNRIISNKQEAEEIISQVIKLIETTHNDIVGAVYH
ncbi:type II toxin-antitoxin system RnlA family toxin [Parageobacillus toebii]|uniref:type II toxin-antitoxin system RnlA family toxin n=1 Tax=Parageobacillus toebii TaxID=153151 RepID=UPI002E1FE8EE|nr:type II toxin-antitoxin system RnlA family toxin [Parageobacillus toebii]